jgi:hypothetical protein
MCLLQNLPNLQQNAKFVNTVVGGTYSYHLALNGLNLKRINASGYRTFHVYYPYR